MRTGFTSQNMTGPFPSVTRNSFRLVFRFLGFCDRPYFSCCSISHSMCESYDLAALSQLCIMRPGFA